MVSSTHPVSDGSLTNGANIQLKLDLSYQSSHPEGKFPHPDSKLSFLYMYLDHLDKTDAMVESHLQFGKVPIAA